MKLPSKRYEEIKKIAIKMIAADNVSESTVKPIFASEKMQQSMYVHTEK